MRSLLFAGLAALALSAASVPAVAQTPPPPSASRTATEAENARIVVAFYDLAFNQHRPTEAARLYIGDRYIQHNPDVPNGAEPFYAYFEGFFRDNPQSRATIHRVIADGDLVALHVHSQETLDDPGRATTANGNTMFSGDKAD